MKSLKFNGTHAHTQKNRTDKIKDEHEMNKFFWSKKFVLLVHYMRKNITHSIAMGQRALRATEWKGLEETL